MPVTEVAIWSAMLGGLLTLAGLALGDVLGHRTTAAWRNLMFVLVTGASCVVMSGLPEHVFPELPARVVFVIKACLGPLAGAMGLFFIGTWLGGLREDSKVHYLTAWGAVALLTAAIVLAVVAMRADLADGHRVLWVSAAVNLVPVVLAMLAVRRASRLGDPLAPWMLLAIVCLAAMVSGHYLHGLNVHGLGTGTRILTAATTVAFFLIASVLGVVRNRQIRQLARLSRLEPGADAATGLHSGAALVTDIEHVFWRTARLQGECTVVCLHLNNLYELTEQCGSGVEHQILATVAARIRRAAGFRCVVGLYHPRCFVVVIHTDRHQAPVAETVERLRSMVGQPMVVVDRQQVRQVFRPQLGVAALTVDPTDALPLEVLNAAERQAAASLNAVPPSRAADTVTAPAPLG
ncbi:MAG: GGDEF domain-containing protein [Hydrogenophaga sp.]